MKVVTVRWLKILGVIFATVWFFPVSCTSNFFAGTRIVAEIDDPNVEYGDTLHSLFWMVAQPGGDGIPFQVFTQENLETLKEYVELERRQPGEFARTDREFSFLMQESGGSMDSDDSNYS